MKTASAALAAAASSVVKDRRLRGDVLGTSSAKPRLEDRHLAALQGGDLGRIIVDAGDDVAELGKACAGNQADITRANHRNVHRRLSPHMNHALWLSPNASSVPAGGTLALAMQEP